MKLNNKGFTLIEMITAITILGIVSIIALPIISNSGESSKLKKYELYKSSLESAAKLYIDSDGLDEFGSSDTGCIDIPFKVLNVDKGLIEDIDIKDISCNNDKTIVRVFKNDNTYSYETYLNCKDKNGKIVYPKNGVEITPVDSCDGTVDTNGPKITFDPDGSTDPTKNITVKIKITDSYGFSPNAKVEYRWIDPDGNAISSKSKSFSNKYLKSTTTELTIPNVTAPDNLTGLYRLEVVPIILMDSIGNSSTETVKSNEYLLDNKKPEITSSSVVETNGSYLEFNTTDNTILKEYAVTKTNTTPTTGWVEIDGTSHHYKKKKIPDTYYIYVKDKAGNIAKKEQEVKPDIPGAPIISGECNWDNNNRIVWVSTPATSVMGIEKYKYCMNTTNTTNNCTWKELNNNTDGSVNGLDVAYYHASNKDLINAFSGNVGYLVDHYNTYGKNEGRKPSNENWMRTAQSFSKHGNYYIFFKAIGKSGYESTVSNSVNIKIDKEGPKYECNGPQLTNNTTNEGAKMICRTEPNLDYFFTCRTYDNESGLRDRYAEWGGNVELTKKGRYNNNNQPALSGATAYNDTLCAASANGKVELRACDQLGNCTSKLINY